MFAKTIAHIRTDFKTKFGVPRQAGLTKGLVSRIVFEPEYRIADALRGLEDYSHLWIIWEFNKVTEGTKGADGSEGADAFRPTVRPPRLGGNQRMGVFATRSPFRPNPIGLSSVRIDHIDYNTPDGPVIYVCGADMMDMTPILDIKPYLPFTDSHPDANGGFTQQTAVIEPLEVHVAPEVETLLQDSLGTERYDALIEVLSQDPRPHYHDDPNRVYGMEFGGRDIKFKVNNKILHVIDA